MPKMDLTDFVTLRPGTLGILEGLGLFISAVEVSQAIQYSRAEEHLTDPTDRGPDNSVRLVAGKPAWVRVYVRSLFGASAVSGTLEVQRRSSGFLFTTAVILNSRPPGTVSASWQPDYATERGTLGATLNFIIPAAEMIGTLRLIARVAAGARNDEFRLDLPVTLQQTLRLAGITVTYNGPASAAPNAPNLNLPAPTIAQMQATAAWTLTAFPVRSTANYRIAGTLNWNQVLTGAATNPGGCSQGWINLNAAVAQQRIADGNQAGWVYYGMLPAGVPMGPVVGCESSGVSSGTVDGTFGAQITMAHEIGHGCGLSHAPSGGVGTSADPNYPAYEPYDTPTTRQASIGEWGLDINNGNLMSPQIFRDVMSYCNTNWISLYQYQRLLNNNRLNPDTVGVDLPWWVNLVEEELPKYPKIPLPDPPPYEPFLPLYPPPRLPENLISVVGTLTREGQVRVSHVARTRARSEVERSESTAMVARLLGRDGAVLAEAPVVGLVSLSGGGGCGCGGPGHHKSPPELLQALIPDVAPGAALEIREGDKALWRREAPSNPVEVVQFTASITREALHAGWETRGEMIEGWLRWSRDRETWQAFATGLTGREAVVPLQGLPTGKVLVEFVAHDGFFSARATPLELEIPNRGPDVTILHPHAGYTYAGDQTIRLWCAAASADGSTVAVENCVWSLDGKQLGRRHDIWIEAPSRAGEHTLLLTVHDAHGTAKVKVSFKIEAPLAAPRRRPRR